MKNRYATIAALTLTVLLAGCIGGKETIGHEQLLENPLYAEWYYDDLVDHLVDIEIQNDPLLEDDAMKRLIDDRREDALEKAREAVQRQQQGRKGGIFSDFGWAQGEVLMVDDMLYLGPDFDVIPGPSLHAYVSTVLDPRDGIFPDETAHDLGILKTPYGEQSYEVPTVKSVAETGSGTVAPGYRTFVIYDTTFKRIYGFAQLQE